MGFRAVGDMSAIDRPAKRVSAVIPRKSTDPKRHIKREFAGTVVSMLRRAMLAGRFDRLILVAPHAYLGDLREELPKDLNDKVAGDVASDLTNTPEQDLPARVRDILERAA
jgi:protein required for attachment to host cells